MRVVLVTGSRYLKSDVEYQRLANALKELDPKLVIHGDAPGADTMAKEWAEYHDVFCLPFPAQWDELGKRAGPERNKAMVRVAIELVDYGHEVIVAAFPIANSKGTIHCMNEASKAGLDVRRWDKL